MANHFTAVDTSAWPYVKDIIRISDRFFVMLDNDNGIALIPKVFKRGEQPSIITLMQPYRWLVQNVKHACKPTSYLTGKPNTLAFPSR